MPALQKMERDGVDIVEGASLKPWSALEGGADPTVKPKSYKNSC